MQQVSEALPIIDRVRDHTIKMTSNNVLFQNNTQVCKTMKAFPDGTPYSQVYDTSCDSVSMHAGIVQTDRLCRVLQGVWRLSIPPME
jgi:hypothetical protein